MHIGLTGASGFIGRAFTAAATAAGHMVTGFSRHPQAGWRRLAETDFSGLDAVVHLAGENVFGLWTRGRKRNIRESRVDLTRRLVEAMTTLPKPPRILVAASGVAWYGDRGDEELDESSGLGAGFLAEVVRDWEMETARAASFARCVSVRFGMVLGAGGGGWPKLQRIFHSGLGGRLGAGRQWMAWIHLTDAARLLLHCIESELSGPVNGVAPEQLRNADFTKLLARMLHRPACLPAPTWALKLLPGGMGRLFLDSTRVHPRRALEDGFQFTFPTLSAAVHALLNPSPSRSASSANADARETDGADKQE
ncbi:MAG: TIGR01777 family oxidoreductase [Verrucomicrobiales bacterium]|nr:TIGR01777 family oxidoreductase [Verrucomicrobiales bacterium]